MSGVITDLILFGAYLSILTFCGYVIFRKRRNENLYHSSAFFCFGILMFKIHAALCSNSVAAPFSWLFCLSVPYFPVPLLYFGYCRVVTFDSKLSLRKLLVLMPSVLVFLYDLSKAVFSFSGDELLTKMIIAGALVQALVFLAAMGKKLSILMGNKEYYLIIRITMAYLVFSGAAYSFVIAGWILDKPVFLMIGGSIVTFLLAGNYLMDLHNGKFRHLLIIEANREKNKYTLLKGVDAAAMLAKLEAFMTESRLYSDETLSLADLSRRLNLSPHQLSQLINDGYRMNFNSFINSYRIEEAKHLLSSSRTMTILSVAYAVGFNSKTAFYTAFSKATGTTPQKFRSEL